MDSNDIVKLGEDVATAVIAAAEDQVHQAQANLERAKSVADIIRSQTNDEARRIDDGIASRKAGIEKILEGYRVIEGKEPAKSREERKRDDSGRDDRDDATERQFRAAWSGELGKLNASVPSLVDGRR